MKDIKKALGLRVRELRTKQEISQEELADRAGLHWTYVGGVERGEKNVTLETMFKLSQGLGIDVTDLFAFAKQKPQAGENKVFTAEIYNLVKNLEPKNREIVKRVIKTLVKELEN